MIKNCINYIIIKTFSGESNIDTLKRNTYFYYIILKSNATAFLNKFTDIIIYIKSIFIKFKNEIKETKLLSNSNERIYFNKRNKKFTNFLLFQIFILINTILLVNSQYIKKIKNRRLHFSNEITIKTLGNEKKNILNSEFASKPDQIYLNGVLSTINSENEIASLPEGENNIRMVWNSQIENCASMFDGLDNIIEVDLSKFDSSKVTSMFYMFCDCMNVLSIIFDNIDTSSVTDMSGLVYNCESLVTLDLSKINTRSLKTINNMFYSCKSLISLDISNFNTSSVISTASLFENCISIQTLNLSSFNPENVMIMTSMFENCTELTSLDISNFDTSNVFIMNFMFNNCHKLSYINLSNVKLLSSFNADYFLANCTNLEFIDLTNFRESTNFNGDNIFEGSSDNFSYCINNIDENPIIMGSINNKYCTINDCSNIWKVKQKKIISEKNKCVYDCIEDENYPFTFKNKCYNKCQDGTYLSNEEEKICSIKCTEELPYEKNDECFEGCTVTEFLSKICSIKNKTVQAIENMIIFVIIIHI